MMLQNNELKVLKLEQKRCFLFSACIVTLAIIVNIQSALGQASSENDDTVTITKGAGGNLEGGDSSVSEAGQDCVAAQNCFSPNTLVIDVGQTVTWLNDDVMGHTVTSGQPSDNQTGTIFDSPAIVPGKEFS